MFLKILKTTILLFIYVFFLIFICFYLFLFYFSLSIYIVSHILSYIFLTLSQILKLKSPGLTLLFLVLSKIERRLTNGTVAIHLLKFMLYIFLPIIMPNVFSSLLKPLSSIENVNLSNSNFSRDFWHLAIYFFIFPSFTSTRWLHSCLFFF